MARTAIVYPRIPDGGVYMRSAKSIEDATGDTPTTTNATWIEDQKFGFQTSNTAESCSYEFDTAETRTGGKTLKVSTTDNTGRCVVVTSSTTAADDLRANGIRVKPSTEYTFSIYAKTNNVFADGCYVTCRESDADGGNTVNTDTNKISGTQDWTLLTATFTTAATTKYLRPHLRNQLAGNVSDIWFDVNGMTLVES